MLLYSFSDNAVYLRPLGVEKNNPRVPQALGVLFPRQLEVLLFGVCAV